MSQHTVKTKQSQYTVTAHGHSTQSRRCRTDAVHVKPFSAGAAPEVDISIEGLGHLLCGQLVADLKQSPEDENWAQHWIASANQHPMSTGTDLYQRINVST